VSQPTTRVVATQNTEQRFEQAVNTDRPALIYAGLGRYALLGAAATAMLSVIEWADLSFQLTPVFASISERLILASYFSINLIVGSAIGLLVGLFALSAAFLKRHFQSALARGTSPRAPHKLIAGIGVSALFAVLLTLQPQIHGYSVTLLREAEKFPHLGRPLTAAEPELSYFVVMGLFIGCSIIWTLARESGLWSPFLRRAWLLGLLVIIGAAYYVDSRVEVQQYEYSLHRSMFLLATALAMALVASIFSSPAAARLAFAGRGSLLKVILSAIVAVLLAAVAFTFARFDNNQNLKTQVFYRTTQTKQYFKLAQWALDFDRDGYSPYLGGGDRDDSRADINPGVTDIAADGIDNNCIGGDLTEQGIEDWQRQFTTLHGASNPARPLNVIFFFIDTLRADHLGAYGYNRNTSPNIDKLAAQSSVFQNAYSPSPYTYEAAPKFMQSTYWDAHNETWTEALARNGYNTILFPRRLSMLLRHVKGMEQTVDASKYSEAFRRIVPSARTFMFPILTVLTSPTQGLTSGHRLSIATTVKSPTPTIIWADCLTGWNRAAASTTRWL